MSTLTLSHNEVAVQILDGPYQHNAAPTGEAIAAYQRLVAMLPALRDYVASQLLETYNESWADEDEGYPTLDQPSFVAQLGEATVVLYDEIGAAVVYFEDGDLFGGHSIEVGVQDFVPTDAQIVG